MSTTIEPDVEILSALGENVVAKAVYTVNQVPGAAGTYLFRHDPETETTTTVARFLLPVNADIFITDFADYFKDQAE